ncbi:MAG: cation:proton antiporter [Acidobacteriota bacterium]|nr:MAG: cation:proton antiporter [Acidobacteriota bacterium]
MHTPQLFTDLLIILLASVPVAFICVRLKLPLIAGFMVAGMAIGPYGLGLIKDTSAIEVLAEIGVMLLLFTIGLEFSPTRLKEMRRNVLIGGGLQVTITIAAVTLIAFLLGRAWNQALFFGFLIALSSTAIVLKSYVERNEVDSPHGRVSIGILIFQDLSILVMLLLIPLIGNAGEMTLAEALKQLAISVVAMAAIVVASWFLIQPLLSKIVSLRSPEVFLLTVVFLLMAFSWATSHFGMSLALGAFIAGVVIANSDYSHQSETEVLPFRDVFNSIFFVSIGLLLSLATLFENIGFVAVLVVTLMMMKALIVWMVVRILGNPQRVAVVAALGLAQIGEFSFVLAKAGQGAGLLPDADYQSFLAASVISMLATPFLIAWAPNIGFAMQKVLSDGSRGEIENCEDDIHMTSSGGLTQHVIIVGYGLNGRNLARVLRTVGVPYTILDLQADVVKKAKADGEKINFGDATRRDVLIHAGIDTAWVLVLALSDPPAARRAVTQARQCNPNVHIIVRTRYTSEITELTGLGANEVIPEEFETSIEIFARVLHRFGMPRPTIEDQIARVRRQKYQMLRSPSIPQPAAASLETVLQQLVTETVRVEAGSPVVGKSLGVLDLRGKTGATVLAVVHEDDTNVSPGANYTLCEGDTLLISGSAAKIEKAIEMIRPDGDIGGFNP